MQQLTTENLLIVGEAMLKIAFNFWPVIVFIIAYAVWETYVLNARPKSKTANKHRVRSQYSRDAAQQTGRRHL